MDTEKKIIDEMIGFFKKYDDGKIRDCWNIMNELKSVGNGYQAADALYLLLSHGGDPNIMLNYETGDKR